MKKLLFGIAFFMGAMMFSSLSVQAEEDAYTPKIEENGSVITVTVCGRRTSFFGALNGFSCDQIATTKCVFFNFTPPEPPE
ncbi:hypothetical protein [Algoriphagus antarcticus]|uniref:Uncharacterized protein n=1 Tax=Algoriphagus antarcticus TaxID=238540 RepID=A0A3E0DR31_9BACT|nr:hypothetical protein [Algoriphagus antarcticus]REG85464.1 hypothetical protein C8N25_113156 [Algoriphagus antarcticus]